MEKQPPSHQCTQGTARFTLLLVAHGVGARSSGVLLFGVIPRWLLRPVPVECRDWGIEVRRGLPLFFAGMMGRPPSGRLSTWRGCGSRGFAGSSETLLGSELSPPSSLLSRVSFGMVRALRERLSAT